MRTNGKVAAAVVAASALILGGCGGDASEPAVETVTETMPRSESPPREEAREAADDEARGEAGARQEVDGDDPVFAAIDAVLAERPGAVVVGIDRDDRESYDVDVVQDGQVVELEVGPDGAVREDEREGDDDDVRDAQAATVTAVDAIRQALDQHPDGVLDEIDLDEDDGTLRWEIELDDADRNDLVELDLPAT